MLVVGELINSTRKVIRPAIESQDAAFIQDLAQKQADAGAHYIDCNAATVGVEREPEMLSWVVQKVQEVVDLPCAIDSPNAAAMVSALQVHRGKPMINSITAEQAKLDSLLPVVEKNACKVIALCMGDGGMPQDVEERLKNARLLVERLRDVGVADEDIYLDPLVCPVSTDSRFGKIVIDTLRAMKAEFPEVQTICGLSNVSFGLPERKWINRAFMVLTMAAGLDAVIIDPLDRVMMALIYAAEATLGKDEFCMEYLSAARSGRLEGLQ